MESISFHKHWGAEFIAADTVRFRVWAEGQKTMTLSLKTRDIPMEAAGGGWFQIDVPGVKHGDEYMLLLADGRRIPDPATRAQRDDVNGPSVVIDPRLFQPVNRVWKGRPWEETVIYELHPGTFTPEGTFLAAIDKLPYLAELGITQVEIMPVAQFGGSRGWGYDGVLLYAPHAAYGSPGDFHAFIDAAHGLGLSVVLDIVLNHFGPEGNYLSLLSPGFFHQNRMTPWGNAIAYETEAVRQYITEAPLFWLTEYHLDGLRFDAIDQIEDRSARHVLIEIAENIRKAIPDRHIHLTTEDSRNVIFLHPRDEDGQTPLFTAEWNDDFHNAAHVFATGETHAYYQDFAHQPASKFARALAEGFVYQGELSAQTGKPRGVACAAVFCRLYSESRSDRKPCAGGKVDLPCRRRENARFARRFASVAAYSLAVYGRGVRREQSLFVLYRFSGFPREGGAGRAGKRVCRTRGARQIRPGPERSPDLYSF